MAKTKLLFFVISVFFAVLLSSCAYLSHEHTTSSASCTEDAVCAICSKTVAEALGHDVLAASCTEGERCARCGAVLSDPLGHIEVAPTCAKEGYCSVCGIKIADKLSHTISKASCTNSERCLICKEVFAPPLGHIIIKATCSDGAHCSRCLEYLSLPDASKHEYTVTAAKDPGCDKEGYTEYTCKNCSHSYTEAIDAKGHIVYGKHCRICGEKIVKLKIPMLYQGTAYPNGCESVSTVMALNYMGIDVSVERFITKYLPMAPLEPKGDGVFVTEDPYYYYIGDPRALNGYYCFAPAIEKAVNKLIAKSEYQCICPNKVSLDELCRKYIDNDIPVVIWSTLNMQKLSYSRKNPWIIKNRTQRHRVISNLHCVLLVGYDDDRYYINDPLRGMVSYSKAVVEASYKALGKQAIVISKKAPPGTFINNADGYQLMTENTTEVKSGDYNLKKGVFGYKVSCVQKALDLTLENYGRFDSTTKSAVKEFQKENGLDETGEVDVETWLALGLTKKEWLTYDTYVSPSQYVYGMTRDEIVDIFIAAAKSYLGKEYIVGASGTPDQGVDCSGLVLQCMYSIGMNPEGYDPRQHTQNEFNCRLMYNDPHFIKVKEKDLLPGDLVFYMNQYNMISHVAIYIGNGRCIESVKSGVHNYPLHKESMTLAGFRRILY